MSKSNAGRIGVWGASGSGKSAYVKQKIKNLKRLIVFDTEDEYATLRMKRCTTAEQVRLAMIANWEGFRIAYVPTPGKEPRALSQLSRLLIKAQEGYKAGGAGQGITLVVEEMNNSFKLHCENHAPGFGEICSRGRKRGIEVIGVSQLISEVSTRFRSNCTETVVLRQQGKPAVTAACNTIGVDKSVVMAIKNLEYLHEQNGEVTKGKIKFK